MRDTATIAAEIARTVSSAAYPDSRFGRDFSKFIPRFEGSQIAAATLMQTPECQHARYVFVTPDNALTAVRHMLLRRGVDIVVPSYGLHRGFLCVDASSLPSGAAPYAAWLDGVEHFGRHVSLEELRTRGRLDLLVTGASAISSDGARFGMGHEYLDVEWLLLRAAGVVDEQTPVAALVHDLQITHEPVAIRASDLIADIIVTSTSIIRTQRRPRPSTIDWSLVSEQLRQTSVFEEFEQFA